MPVKPENGGEDADKEYERAVKRRDDKMKVAQDLAEQFNKRTAEWIYFLDEKTVNAIRPDEESMIQKPN